MRMNEKKEKISLGLINRILLIVLVVTFLSGILLQIFQDESAFVILHKLSSTALLLGVIVHVLQCRKKGKRNDE